MKRVICLFLLIIGMTIGAVPGPSSAKNPLQARQTEGAKPRADRESPAVPGQYLVKFKPSSNKAARQADLAAIGATIVKHIDPLSVEVVEFAALKQAPTAEAKARTLEALKKNPNVEYVEPNGISTAAFTPNDPSYGQQWAWNKIQAPQAWDITKGSSSVVIAVVDSGVQANHADLDAKIVAGYDYVDNDSNPNDGHGHGTHVSGTAAAETNNSTGVAGTCPNCKIMGVRVLDNNGSGSWDNIANGIIYAADHGAQVINLSIQGGFSQVVEDAVTYAWGKGSFLACAAGNQGSSTPSYPGASANCFGVANTTSSDARASSSNYGSWVEIAAPGSDIYSTYINGGYTNMTGTSMASPHVAGLAGLLASQGLNKTQIRDRLCSTADKISGTGSSWTCGRINAYKAVSTDNGTPTPTPVTPTPVTPTPTTTPGGNVIVNGGFESGANPWQQYSSGGYQVISTQRPHAGSYGAYFGDFNNANESIYQTVTVPANAALKYWWYMSTQETSGAWDYLRVRVYSNSGTLLATLRTWSNASTKNTWTQDTVSLSAYAGQTVRIQFEATTDSNLTSAFFVDDVSTQ